MHTVSLFDAKTHLSRFVEELIGGREDSIVVSRRGKPVVKIIPIGKTDIWRSSRWICARVSTACMPPPAINSMKCPMILML